MTYYQTLDPILTEIIKLWFILGQFTLSKPDLITIDQLDRDDDVLTIYNAISHEFFKIQMKG